MPNTRVRLLSVCLVSIGFLSLAVVACTNAHPPQIVPLQPKRVSTKSGEGQYEDEYHFTLETANGNYLYNSGFSLNPGIRRQNIYVYQTTP